MFNNKTCHLLGLVAACLAGSGTTLAEDHASLRIGTGEWSPIAGKQLPGGGPVNKIAAELFRAMGYQAEFLFMPWPDVYKLVADGRVDVTSCSWKTKEREENFLFGEPVLNGRVVFIKRRGDPWSFKGMDSLNGKRVAILPGYGYGDQFLKATNFSRETSPDLATALKKLASGSIDLAIDDELVALHHLKKVSPSMVARLELDTRPVLRFPCYLAVSKKLPGASRLVSEMDKELKKMKADKRYGKILGSDGLVE